jgi:hypothetical protein
LHWGFEDPSSLQLSAEKKVNCTRAIRDEIKAKVIAWLARWIIDNEEKNRHH